ncbi:MAG TPA: DUF4185 domain-containing protein [Candidatus Polarisedimenticolaceae bacterium]
MLGAPAPPEVLATLDLGSLETNPTISGRDGAYSTRVGGMSVWVYGDTVLNQPGADGGTWRNNTLSWTRDLFSPDGITGLGDRADAIGGPVQFLPMTADELLYNDLHRGENCREPPCGWSYGLWPGMLVFDAERRRVLYTYGKLHFGPGAWNFTLVGTGIAVGEPSPDGAVTRPTVAPGSPEPTLLFGAGEPGFLNAAFVESIGGVPHAYFYDCSGGDGFTKPMHVARVPLANVHDRSAWRFWSTDGTWRSDLSGLAIVFDGSDQLSVHWSPFHGRYLAVYVQALTYNVVARLADRPEGPWSDPAVMFVTPPPAEGGWVYCGMAHPEFARDGGRFETVTYVRDTGFLQSERHVVEVEFARRVASDDRDAGYDPAGGVGLSDPEHPGEICFGMDPTLWRQAAIAFPLHLPRGSTITEASVGLVSSGTNLGAPAIAVRSIAEDDVAPFVAGNGTSFTDAYALSAAAVPWAPEDAPAGTSVATPDLRALLQEVVDRPGWTAGNHLGLVFPEVRTKRQLRCFADASSAAGDAAILRVGHYVRGAAVCLDARDGDDALRVSREPEPGCAPAPPGPAREFVSVRLGALRALGGIVDLGPVRCAGDASPTTEQVVRAADPDEAAGDARVYLVRAAGSPDFGTAKLPDGSMPTRIPVIVSCP